MDKNLAKEIAERIATEVLANRTSETEEEKEDAGTSKLDLILDTLKNGK